MYRVQAERPDASLAPVPAPPKPRAPTVLDVGRLSRLQSYAGTFVCGFFTIFCSFFGLPALVFTLTFGLAGLLFFFATVTTRVIVDPEKHTVSWGKQVLAFSDIRFARLEPGPPATLYIVKRGDEVGVAFGSLARVQAAIRAINHALAHLYESTHDMPAELAEYVGGTDGPFPFSSLGARSDANAQDIVKTFFREILSGDVQTEVRDNTVIARGRATGSDRAVMLRYALRKDQLEVRVDAVSKQGPFNLLNQKINDLDILGSGLVRIGEHLFINGEKKRAHFEAMPKAARKNALEGLQRLNLRQIQVDGKQLRLHSSDGMRSLRDPRARVEAMIALAVDVADAVSR